MDVTRSNFQSVLDTLDEILGAATFVSIDAEFTGLQEGEARMSPMDRPEERYKFLREGSRNFLLIQFGLCVFTYDRLTKKYIYKTFNFYIFPNTISVPGVSFPDPKFVCQASSLIFLIAQGFDFNKLIREGIPYLTLADEERLRVLIEEKQKAASTAASTPTSNHIPNIPAEQKSFMESTFTKIQGFLEGDEEQLVLENCSAFQRKLIFTHGRSRYPEAYFESKVTEKQERVMIVQKNSPQLQQQVQENNRKLDSEQLENAIGFSKVLRKITESGKLVVGHNMLLDVCHILHQFYGDLPEKYEEFKTLASSVFPKLIDTKVMAGTHPFRERLPNSALEPLLKTLSEKPFRLGSVEPAADFPSYNLYSGKAHEAGYDAYLTGLCFISMCNYLGDLSDNYEEVLPESAFIPPFLQKVYMMRVQDIPYMNLAGPDLEPSRDHVFYMTFPKEWKTQDIFSLFSVYGPVTVNWVCDTSAFVSLLRKENKDLVMKNITAPPGCTLVPYREHAPYPVADHQAVHSEKACSRKRSNSPLETATATARTTITETETTAPVRKKSKKANSQKKKEVSHTPKEAKSVQFEVPDKWD